MSVWLQRCCPFGKLCDIDVCVGKHEHYEFNVYGSKFYFLKLFSTRRNRNLNLTEYYDLIYEYKNDCLVAGIKYKKNYYNDADIKPVEELFFSITIIPLTTLSSNKMALK